MRAQAAELERELRARETAAAEAAAAASEANSGAEARQRELDALQSEIWAKVRRAYFGAVDLPVQSSCLC